MPTPGQQSPFFWPGMDGKPPNFITREKTTKKGGQIVMKPCQS